MLDSERAYKILGLGYGAPQDEIKKAYIAWVKRCHPDRFHHSPHLQHLNQEKLKEINEAYAYLKRKPAVFHYKNPYPHKHQAPPKPAYKTYHTTTAKGAGFAHARPGTKSRSAGKTRATGATSPEQWLAMFLVFCLFVGLLVLLFQQNPLNDYSATSSREATAGWADPENRSQPLPATRSRVAESPTAVPEAEGPWSIVPAAARSRPPANEARTFRGGEEEAPGVSGRNEFFTVGSTKNEVLAVQGTPDELGENDFRYGVSSVFFKNGKVTRWQNFAASPLKARMPSAKPGGSFFTLGSTKEEVVAVQGEPDSRSEHAFEYGISRVFFQNNRVTSWKSYSVAPLRVKLSPAHGSRDSFTLGSSRDAVIAAQGTPDEYSEGRFGYGLSSVSFEQGRVKAWRIDPSRPLKVQMASGHAAPDYFTLGSAWEEVIAVQGTPDELGDKQLAYGLSTIGIEKGRVAAWQIHPDRPLKIRMPEAKSGREYFTVGSSLEEVITVQGIPDELAGNKLGYGLSSVFLEKGRVKSWRNYSSSPLRVQLHSLPENE